MCKEYDKSGKAVWNLYFAQTATYPLENDAEKSDRDESERKSESP